LRKIVLERERTTPALDRSNFGGWQSERDFLDWPHPEMATLRDWISEAVSEMTGHTFEDESLRVDGSINVVAWANVLRRGNYHRVQNHPGFSWSGVYYVSLGGKPASAADGLIELVDPRGASNMIGTPGLAFEKLVRILPRVGEMILFPSFLQNYVNPYEGNELRIYIAFNVSMQDMRVMVEPMAPTGADSAGGGPTAVTNYPAPPQQLRMPRARGKP
jgi:uncharacterized protein (TIGR02466 family)